MVSMKWGNRGTRALYVGWDSLANEGKTASLELLMNPKVGFKDVDGITFEFSEAKEDSYPDKEDDKNNINVNSNSSNDNEILEETEKEENDDDEDDEAPLPIDFTIELKDTMGNIESLLLSEFSFLQRQLEVDILKNPELESNDKSEAIYSTFFIGRNLLSLKSSTLNLDQLSSIKLIFNQTPQGVIIIDKVMVFH
jgi:hypothetical protein